MGKIPVPLSPEAKGSFAYFTVKDRLPVILTRTIDYLCRHKLLISDEYGQETLEEIKEIIGQLSQLKNEMLTNKPLSLFSDNYGDSDNEVWNSAIHFLKEESGTEPKWFSASWLFVECYLYKRINEIFACSHTLKSYDPFRNQKEEACKSSTETIKSLCEYVLKLSSNSFCSTLEAKKDIIFEMVQVSLWGNQCDLSISSGANISPQSNLILRLKELSDSIICSEEESLWQYLNKIPESSRHIAFVLDNAGLELVSDLCLATILTECKLASSITFYTKTSPWFVSDTMFVDISWSLEYMRNLGEEAAEMSAIFSGYLENETWEIRESPFWTSPYDFSKMKDYDPELYQELGNYSLIIFKGDLNYRKLVGDLDWPNDTPFKTALRGFLPSSLLVLRTVKGGPVVGLDETSPKVQRAKSKEDWYKSGDIGLIQFVSNSDPISLSMCLVAGLFFAVIAILLRFVL